MNYSEMGHGRRAAQSHWKQRQMWKRLREDDAGQV